MNKFDITLNQINKQIWDQVVDKVCNQVNKQVCLRVVNQVYDDTDMRIDITIRTNINNPLFIQIINEYI
jgi:hypothetical protein